MRYIAACLINLITSIAHADLLADFARLGTKPIPVPYGQQLDFNQRGGHLQGIQRFGDTYLVSGSSSTAAYLVAVDPKGNADRYFTLRRKPLKHAGGFQVNDGLLAIGLEDNDTRTRSVVAIYDVATRLDIESGPIATINRQGARERMTAGAVGIARHGQATLVVVANWDAREIDFYRAQEEPVELDAAIGWDTEATAIRLPFAAATYERFAVLTPAGLDQADWVTPGWHSYQNINLFSEGTSLFLLGTASVAGQQVADLFRIHLTDTRPTGLTKVASRNFEMPGKAQFKWGSGAWREPDGALVIGTTTRDLAASGEIVLLR